MDGSSESGKSGSPANQNPVGAERLTELREHYDTADAFCKEVQTFLEEAGIPAINELRYAGYHLLYALSDDSEPPDDQMIKAINHCKRASYEAAEAGIVTCLDQINRFKGDFSAVSITDVVGSWIEILTECDQCKERLTLSREKGDDRAADYSEHMEAFRKLTKHCSLLEQSRSELNKKIETSREEQRRFVIIVGLTVLGILVTAGGIILTL